MLVKEFTDRLAMAEAAAQHAAASIREAIRVRDHARILAATGTSQFEFLEALVREAQIKRTDRVVKPSASISSGHRSGKMARRFLEIRRPVVA